MNVTELARIEAEAAEANTPNGVWSHSQPGSKAVVKPFYAPWTIVYANGHVAHAQVLNGKPLSAGVNLLGAVAIFRGHLDNQLIREAGATVDLPWK